MKKFLLLFISILSLSLFISTNKTYAQQPINNYPDTVMLVPFNFLHEPIVYENSYEFLVDYKVDGICINNIFRSDYFLVNEIGISLNKGINRNTNSYEIRNYWCGLTPSTHTWITLEVNVLKSLANNYNYPDDEENIEFLFTRDTALYMFRYSIRGTIAYDIGYHNGFVQGYKDKYYIGEFAGYSDAQNLELDRGYNDGYNDGYIDGYNEGLEEYQQIAYREGYEEGYEAGRNDKRFKLISNIHIWIIPAIILVFSLSIYISYRKGDKL